MIIFIILFCDSNSNRRWEIIDFIILFDNRGSSLRLSVLTLHLRVLFTWIAYTLLGEIPQWYLLATIDTLKSIVTVIIPVCAKEEMFRRSRDMSTMIYAELSIHYIVL